jgi:hypothetical protein
LQRQGPVADISRESRVLGVPHTGGFMDEDGAREGFRFEPSKRIEREEDAALLSDVEGPQAEPAGPVAASDLGVRRVFGERGKVRSPNGVGHVLR